MIKPAFKMIIDDHLEMTLALAHDVLRFARHVCPNVFYGRIENTLHGFPAVEEMILIVGACVVKVVACRIPGERGTVSRKKVLAGARNLWNSSKG
jgi:hypothetical protein